MMVSFGLRCLSIFMPPHGDPHRHRSLSIRSQFLATHCRYENLIWCLEPRLNRLSQKKTHLEFQQIWNSPEGGRIRYELVTMAPDMPYAFIKKTLYCSLLLHLVYALFLLFPFILWPTQLTEVSPWSSLSTLEEEGEPFITWVVTSPSKELSSPWRL